MRVGCVVEVRAREDDDRGHVPPPGLLQPGPRPRARPAAAAPAWTLQGGQLITSALKSLKYTLYIFIRLVDHWSPRLIAKGCLRETKIIICLSKA